MDGAVLVRAENLLLDEDGNVVENAHLPEALSGGDMREGYYEGHDGECAMYVTYCMYVLPAACMYCMHCMLVLPAGRLGGSGWLGSGVAA